MSSTRQGTTGRRVSAADVAKKAGVSRTTVSFVLNDTPGKSISEETKERVLHAAQKLGYRPNQVAQRLATATRHTVGLLMIRSASLFSDAYVIRLVEGMSQVLNRNRMRLFLCPRQGPPDDYRALVAEGGLEGVIVLSASSDHGLRVPTDVSIAGFDDDYLSRYVRPPLTTVSLPAARIGARAAEILSEQILGGPPIREREVILPAHLVVRESTAPRSSRSGS